MFKQMLFVCKVLRSGGPEGAFAQHPMPTAGSVATRAARAALRLHLGASAGRISFWEASMISGFGSLL